MKYPKLLAVSILLFSLNSFAGPLSGTFKVGQGQYATTISDMVDSLKTYGTNGNVVVELMSETFNEQVYFHSISNSNDTISIEGQSDGSSIVEFAASNTDNYLVKIGNVGNLTFKNIHFKNVGTTHTGIFRLETGANNLWVKGCKLESPIVSSGSGHDNTLVFSNTGNTTVTSITFEKNTFIGGLYGLYISGQDQANPLNGFKLIGNVFEDQYHSAVEFYDTKELEISGNFINSNNTSSAQNAMIVRSYRSGVVENNHIVWKGLMGLQIADHGGDGNTEVLTVVNNRVSCPNGIPFYLNGSYYVDVYHNTFYNHKSGGDCVILNSGEHWNFKNNIVYNSAIGTAIKYTTFNSTNSASDNNHIYTLGSVSFANFDGSATLSTGLSLKGVELSSKLDAAPSLKDTIGLRIDPCSSGGHTAPAVGVALDYRGQTRGATPVVGADEGGWFQEEDRMVLDGYVTDGGTDTLKSGVIILYANVGVNKLFKPIDTVAINASNGYFKFDEVPFYSLMYGYLQTSDPNYINCYHDGTVAWEQNTAKQPQKCASNHYNFKPRKLKAVPSGGNTISGTVYLETTGKATNPIPGLDVVLDKIPPAEGETVAKTITNANGEYTFSNLPDSTFKVLIDYPGIGLTKVHQVTFTGSGNTSSGNDYCVDTTDVVDACGDANSIVSYKDNDVMIYPNPSFDHVTVQLGDSEFTQLRVTSISGELVLFKENFEKIVQLDLTKLSKGVYFIQLNGGEQVSVSQWLIKK